jgi:hypothetical protein
MAKQGKNLSRDQINKLDKRAELQEKAQKDLQGYLDLLKQIQIIEGNLDFLAKEKVIHKQKELSLAADLFDAEATGNADKIAAAKANVKLNKATLKDIEKQVLSQEESLVLHQEALKLVKEHVVVLKSVLNAGKAIAKVLIQQKGYLLEQQKAVKETELTMGVLSSQANAFRQNIYKTALSTTQLGIGSKELAKIQGVYSENVGRTLVLNQENLEAIAQMAAGTTLGAEGAAELAANMENFGISATASRDLVEDMVNRAHAMGVNSGKVIKTMQKNLSLAQKYHFKGGIKGLAKMAALTTKFKMEMESVAGFADKLITPEGAVEAAAQLQVLGGAWAQLGDPFELMFRSRNDLEGLTKDIIDAAQGTARWNKETGEFKIDPMELHRLREVANVTGQSVEELAMMAKQQAKFNKIRSETTGNFSDDNMEFIESLGEYNKNTGKFEVTFSQDGKMVTKNIRDLHKMNNGQFDAIRAQTQTLKERAMQSQTFDDRLDNLINTFKSTLLPGFEVFATALEGGLDKFRTALEDEGVVTAFVDAAKTIGEVLAFVVETMIDHPWISLIGYALGNAALWFTKGISFGAGAKIGMGGMGGFGGRGGGGRGGVGGTGGPKGGGLYNKRGYYNKETGAFQSKGMTGAKGASFHKGGMTGMGKAAVGGSALAGAMAGYGEWSQNADTDMSTSENVGRTLATGGGAMGGALAGAALGSMAGPIGTIVGGIIGGMAGQYGGNAAGDYFGTEKYNDFISRPGSNPVPFSGKDTLIGAKTGGPLDKMLDNSVGSGNVKATSNKMSVEFSKPLMIQGKIELVSDGKTANIDLDNPIFMRELSKSIQEQLSKTIGGGKISSNPVITS